MDAPEVPRLRDAAGEALVPYDSYERFFLGEYRGVVELAYALGPAAPADRGQGPGPGVGQAGAGPGRAAGQGAEPYGLAVTDDAVWATSLVAGTVTRIDPRTDRVAASRPGP